MWTGSRRGVRMGIRPNKHYVGFLNMSQRELPLRAPLGQLLMPRHRERLDLFDRCRAGQAAGMDFPTLWNEVLRPDPLVIGPPVQTVRDGRVRMEVRLITGAAIAFDTDTSTILPD